MPYAISQIRVFYLQNAVYTSRTLISASALFNILAFGQLHPCVAIQSGIEIFYVFFLTTANEPETHATIYRAEFSVLFYTQTICCIFTKGSQ